MRIRERHNAVEIKLGDLVLQGILRIPEDASGVVIFSHGSGSSRNSKRNNFVAEQLQKSRLASLLFDLLTPEEDLVYANRFNIDLLTQRLIAVTWWAQQHKALQRIKIGYFGASTGAASALRAAAFLGTEIHAVVSRGGRPDLALKELPMATAPTLLIVGGSDHPVIRLNEKAYQKLMCQRKLEVIQGATHLFGEPGKLVIVSRISARWFTEYLGKDKLKKDV